MYNILTVSSKPNQKQFLDPTLGKTVSVSSKGQVVIPKAIRKKLNIKRGDRLIFELVDNKIEAHPAPTINEMMGAFGQKGQKPVSIRQMHQAVRKAVVEKYQKN